MNKDDLLFILNTAADLSAHQGTGAAALAGAQAAVKSYIADKEELQDPDVLTALDRLFQISAAAEVPGVFTPESFDLTDYVEPKADAYPEPVLIAPPEAEIQEIPPSSTEADYDTKALLTEEPKE